MKNNTITNKLFLFLFFTKKHFFLRNLFQLYLKK